MGVTKALCRVKSSKTPFRPKELAPQLGVSPSCISRLVQILQPLVDHPRVHIAKGRSELKARTERVLRQLLS